MINNVKDYFRQKAKLETIKSEVEDFENKIVHTSSSKRKRLLGNAKFLPREEIGVGKRYARMWKELKKIIESDGSKIWNASKQEVINLLTKLEIKNSKSRYSRPTIVKKG